MKKPAITTIEVKGTAVSILTGKEGDYISLTDMLKAKDGEFFISDWLRNRNTVEFLGIWESVFNPDFNYGEFATIRSQAGLNSYNINYRIHTDAIKDTLIPPSITKTQASAVYASEADLLNVALFGQTAKQWRDAHPAAEGNIRDHAPLEQLVVLTNLESLNSVLIRQGLPQPDRLATLNDIAITQMRTLLSASSVKRLK